MIISKVDQLKQIIQKAKNVAIITHMNPDGDAIGSASALALLLAAKNIQVNIITPNKAATYLRSIEGFEYVTDFLEKTADAISILRGADLIVCMDFSDYLSRCGEIAPHITKNIAAAKIVIDHHVASDVSGYTLAFCDEKESSTAHILLKTLIAASLDDMITKQIASSIYVGMMTDTGNFSYGNLTPELYRNISLLITKGADPVEINNQIFNVKSENSLRLNGFATSQKMVVDHPSHSAYIILTNEELSRFKYESGDTEGLVNIPLSIDGIYNSALFAEAEGFIKVSLRSIKNRGGDVNQFARKYYSGGGHINAAGARAYNMSADEAAKIFITEIDKF
ncbi:MAG: DHH family phosphoesterase [Rikenellaceae bacterium]